MEQNLSREQQEQDTDFGPISFVHSTRLFYVSFNLRPRLVSTTSSSYSRTSFGRSWCNSMIQTSSTALRMRALCRSRSATAALTRSQALCVMYLCRRVCMHNREAQQSVKLQIYETIKDTNKKKIKHKR